MAPLCRSLALRFGGTRLSHWSLLLLVTFVVGCQALVGDEGDPTATMESDVDDEGPPSMDDGFGFGGAEGGADGPSSGGTDGAGGSLATGGFGSASGGASTGGADGAGGGLPTGGGSNLTPTPCTGGNGVPADIKQIFINAYKKEFGLDVPEPACARSGVDKLYNVTSTLYHPNGNLYRIYWTPDGSLEARKLGDYSDNTPRGRYKVAVLSIDYHTTNAEAVFPEAFVAAGDKINRYFSDYSKRAGLDASLLMYDMEHFLVPREVTAPGANDKDLATFEPYLKSQGYSAGDFDAFVVLDIDAGAPSDGYYGWCCYSKHRLIWATYSRGADVTEAVGTDRVALDGAFFVGFVHEMGHWHGWEHDWAGATKPDTLITAPQLYGWTDTDGDGIVEIYDPTPYGMLL